MGQYLDEDKDAANAARGIGQIAIRMVQCFLRRNGIVRMPRFFGGNVRRRALVDDRPDRRVSEK
jgi:hypothetical protein